MLNIRVAKWELGDLSPVRKDRKNKGNVQLLWARQQGFEMPPSGLNGSSPKKRQWSR